jgi:hypothetical protein
MAMIGGAGVAKTKYYINLTAEERDLLMRIVCEAKESERTIMRARILLMISENIDSFMTVFPILVSIVSIWLYISFCQVLRGSGTTISAGAVCPPLFFIPQKGTVYPCFPLKILLLPPVIPRSL